MNFTLSLLGSSPHQQPALRGNLAHRDTPADLHTSLLQGRWADAADLLEELSGNRIDALFARGQLRLMTGEHAEAAWCFSDGIERLMGAVDGSLEVGAGSQLERMIAAAESALRAGNCDGDAGAASLFGQARCVVNQLLAAEAGLCVAEGRLAGHLRAGRVERLVPLARLGDTLLKAEARARLAATVAQLTGNHAATSDRSWAVGSGRVTELLEGEFDTLAAATRRHPGHAEALARLGLVARALGRNPAAEWALGEVLRLHPHDVAAAGRLGATLIEGGEAATGTVMAILAVALAIPAPTLKQYADLAEAAAAPHFDAAVDAFARTPGGIAHRANLAYALAQMDMLTAGRAAWREPAASLCS